MCVLSHFSRVQLCDLWTAAHQAPLSMGFSRQGYWSGLPCPPPQDLPDPGIEPMSLKSPVLAGWFFTTNATGEAQGLNNHGYKGVRPNFWLSQLTQGCHLGAKVSALYSEVSFIPIEFCQNPNDMGKENFVLVFSFKEDTFGSPI